MNTIFQVMIGATCGFFIAGFGRWIFDRRTQLRLSSFRVFEIETRAILDRLRVTCESRVVTLMWIHNSGRPMAITSLKKSSVIVDSVSAGASNIKADWQGINIFGDDFDIMVTLQDSKSKTTLLFSDQLRDGVLKMRLEKRKLPGAILSEVFVTGMGYYYLMVEVDKNLHETIDNGNMYACKVAQTQLNRLCQLAYNQGILE